MAAYIKGQRFQDIHEMIYRITASSSNIVMLEREGELDPVISRTTQMKPADLDRNINVAGWKLLK